MEKTRQLSDLLIEAENAKKEINNAILSDNASQIEKAKQTMDTAVKEYNEMAIVLDFQTLKSKSAPIQEAIEQLTIACIEAKRNEDRETKIVTYSIEPTIKQISLPAFDKYCRRDKLDITPDKLWTYSVERFCLLVTYRIMKELGGDTKKLEDTYYISDITRQIDMGKTPTSNNQMLAQLQQIVDGVIFKDNDGKNLYKVTSHDVNYIIQTMTRRGKVSGTVVAPKPATMHTLIMDVLHRIVCSKDYKVEYMTKKQKANEDAENTETKKSGIDEDIEKVEKEIVGNDDDMVEITNQYGETKKVKKSSII